MFKIGIKYVGVHTTIFLCVYSTHQITVRLYDTPGVRNDVSSVKNDRKRISLISDTPKIVCKGNILVYISVYSSG